MYKCLERVIKELLSKGNSVIGYFVFYTLAYVSLPPLTAYMPKFMISAIQAGDYALVVKGSIVYALLASLLYWVYNWARTKAYYPIAYARMDTLNLLSSRIVSIDFKHNEDSEFYKKHELGIFSVSGDRHGYQRVLQESFEIPAMILVSLGFALFLFTLSPWVGISFLLYMIATFVGGRLQMSLEEKKREEVSEILKNLQTNYRKASQFSAGKDIRLFGFRKLIMKHFNETLARYDKIYHEIFWGKSLYVIIFFSMYAIADSLLIYTLISSYLAGKINIASFGMYLAIVAEFMLISDTAMLRFTFMLKELISVRQLYEMFDADLISPAGEELYDGQAVTLEFRDVHFTYPKTERKILNGMNFKINAGEKIALVGDNGVGKSTIVKLIMNLYRIDAGEILINGKSVSSYKRDELLRILAPVFQDVQIYPFTFAENIAGCAKPDAEKVRKVLSRLGMENTIKDINSHYDKSLFEDGIELSGGEKQKVAIARALYKDAPMVIMDEPTSALDAIAEGEIYEEMKNLSLGKTLLFISHRLASTKFCDRILLAHDGRIAESGTHDELMKLKGKYRQMFDIQSKYYRESAEAGDSTAPKLENEGGQA